MTDYTRNWSEVQKAMTVGLRGIEYTIVKQSGAMSVTFQNGVDCEGYSIKRIYGTTGTHTAKTGYEIVSPANWWSTNNYILNPPSDGYQRNNNTKTLYPKCVNTGTGSTWSAGIFDNWDKLIAPTGMANSVASYLSSVMENPTYYQDPHHWYYPIGTQPTHPIYFNDFYHIRTPLND